MALFGKYPCYCFVCGTRISSDTIIGGKVCSITCLKTLEKYHARSILGKDSHSVLDTITDIETTEN